MAMPFELEIEIVTEGKEKRLNDNNFQLLKEGYHLYPLNTPLKVKRFLDHNPVGEGVIYKMELSDGITTIQYKLTTLHTTN
ncbi:DUF2584 family protein [Fervidibacillus halotolerans]|uniref:DUF2584 domain-containing protein n=1 Tax=Fervidibacillus halotolerans TaxID=2980027 RepID=A0A9E8LY02_9BACI|nr:DUF2584 family protein [Fervidibacillus halotolerans]WAA11785.1 DUF2584 domain-containing protein [Fervidibacillus halotolerans]